MNYFKSICLTACISVAICASAQAQSQCLDLADSVAVDSVAIVDEPIFDLADVEVKPEFPGGEREMFEFLGKNLKWPDLGETDVFGTVLVEFVIEKDGSLTGAKIVRSPHEAFSDECLRLVGLMPKWNPGMHAGQPVRVKYKLPIRFKLSLD